MAWTAMFFLWKKYRICDTLKNGTWRCKQSNTRCNGAFESHGSRQVGTLAYPFGSLSAGIKKKLRAVE